MKKYYPLTKESGRRLMWFNGVLGTVSYRTAAGGFSFEPLIAEPSYTILGVSTGDDPEEYSTVVACLDVEGRIHTIEIPWSGDMRPIENLERLGIEVADPSSLLRLMRTDCRPDLTAEPKNTAAELCEAFFSEHAEKAGVSDVPPIIMDSLRASEDGCGCCGK